MKPDQNGACNDMRRFAWACVWVTLRALLDSGVAYNRGNDARFKFERT